MYEILAPILSALSVAANGAIWHRMGRVEEKIKTIDEKVESITYVGVRGGVPNGKRKPMD